MITGILQKMRGALNKEDGKVDYHIRYIQSFDQEQAEEVPLIDKLGQKISLKYLGHIVCEGCGKELTKSYQNGYCFPCTKKLAECDICIVRPELCHFEDGTCREPEWGEKHCMIPHYVYLANSSGVKVGITRHTQIPYRWIDQGAIQGLPIFKVSTRLQSGLFEKLLAQEVADKTNWRKMLQSSGEAVDLEGIRDELFETCGEGLDELEEQLGEDQVDFIEDGVVTELDYPVLKYPEKVKSLSFDKTPIVEGVLEGIKGQYLILDSGVMNMRKHIGYAVELNY